MDNKNQILLRTKTVKNPHINIKYDAFEETEEQNPELVSFVSVLFLDFSNSLLVQI